MTDTLPADRIPVIVGVADIADRPADPAQGLEPLALMAEALRQAEADAGASLLARLDALHVVNQISWPYAEPALQLAGLIGASPATAEYGDVGGETPMKFLHKAARRIAAGESAIAAICGAESQSTLDKARKSGARLDWTPRPEKYDSPIRGMDLVHPAALSLGVFLPVTIYPFYENATLAAWGQTPAQAQAESAALWSAFSAVAAETPSGWIRRPHTPQEIALPSASNRLIAWPYTKLMVANPSVNQGAAILVTSLAAARAAGIAESKMIFVLGGAAANEPRDYLQRDTYTHSTAQDAVLRAAQSLGGPDGFSAIELYSCFPIVPKMARRTLLLPPDMVPTVAGGLTFYGAPLNTYMTQATSGMVRRLRAEGGTGLLYGQGEFVTKHHAVVVSTTGPGPGTAAALSRDPSVQATADAARGLVPTFSTDATGPATLETFTVIFDREGAASHGAVIARLGDTRVLARVRGEHEAAIARLTNLDASPVGAHGVVHATGDELRWEFT